MATLRDLLNRLRWDAAAERGDVVVEVRTREGCVDRLEEIEFDSVVSILPHGVEVAGGTYLPYHRVAGVRRGAEILWPPSGERARET
ncbi:MAG TPA: DUF504 domain-containing protein [Thermoanaerobaculaceae bacterium]|nr:DUF504 domain-containing protein [Thermoanaerobaculaceae bacterium]